MKEAFIQSFNRTFKILNIGEYYATDKPDGIATVLGSCIAACIYEENTPVGGMNHFLVPGDFRDEEIFLSPTARYGMYAMELLMGEMIKLKVKRERLRVKIFGGADMLGNTSSNIGENNVSFIKAYLRMEGIPIVSMDVGGKFARKIFFFPDSGKVMVKKITTGVDTIVASEMDFRRKTVMGL